MKRADQLARDAFGTIAVMGPLMVAWYAWQGDRWLALLWVCSAGVCALTAWEAHGRLRGGS